MDCSFVLQYCFAVTWPARGSPNQTKKSRLLAFRDESEATKWHQAICAAISSLATPEMLAQAENSAIPATPTGESSQLSTASHAGTRHNRTSSMPSPLASAVGYRGIDNHLNPPRQLDESDVGCNGVGIGRASGGLGPPGGHVGISRNSEGAHGSQDRHIPAGMGTLNSGMSLETEFANEVAGTVIPEASTDVRSLSSPVLCCATSRWNEYSVRLSAT
jgi:hypothetical protein